MSDGRENKEIEIQIGEANAMLSELRHFVITKREPLSTAKLLAYILMFASNTPMLLIMANNRKVVVSSSSGRDAIIRRRKQHFFPAEQQPCDVVRFCMFPNACLKSSTVQEINHWATYFWSCFFYFDLLVFLGALSPKMTLVFS